MTQRERQLLEWIRENPLISQQELADKAAPLWAPGSMPRKNTTRWCAAGSGR